MLIHVTLGTVARRFAHHIERRIQYRESRVSVLNIVYSRVVCEWRTGLLKEGMHFEDVREETTMYWYKWLDRFQSCAYADLVTTQNRLPIIVGLSRFM